MLYLLLIPFFFQMFIIFFLFLSFPLRFFSVRLSLLISIHFLSLIFSFLLKLLLKSLTVELTLPGSGLPFFHPQISSHSMSSLSCSLLYYYSMFWLNFLFWPTLILHAFALTPLQCSSPCFHHSFFHLCFLQSSMFLSSCLCIQKKKIHMQMSIGFLAIHFFLPALRFHRDRDLCGPLKESEMGVLVCPTCWPHIQTPNKC